MKFKVSQMSVKNGTDATGKPWTMYNFTNMYDGRKYSCFQKAGYTDSFADGYEFEADFTEKPNPKGGTYKNVQWPKVQRGAPQNYQPQNNQLIEAMKIQMDRIEKKIDRIMGVTVAVMPVDETPLEMPQSYYDKVGLPTDIPPIPEEDSTPF